VTDLPRRVHPTWEATRDPVYVLQIKRFIVFKDPDGYSYDGEGFVRDDADPEADDPYLTDKELVSKECAFEYWESESVWFTRDEAEGWAERHAYRFPSGWQVYCMCAEGRLSELLKAQTDRPKEKAK